MLRNVRISLFYQYPVKINVDVNIYEADEMSGNVSNWIQLHLIKLGYQLFICQNLMF